MAHDHFKVALEAALKFFPNIKLKEEQEVCIRSIVLDKMDVLAVLPTGYGKSIICRLESGVRPVRDRSSERDRRFSSSIEYPNDLYSSENSL